MRRRRSRRMYKGQYKSKSVSTIGQTATPARGKSDRTPLKTTIIMKMKTKMASMTTTTLMMMVTNLRRRSQR